jgi:hypothetical protein
MLADGATVHLHLADGEPALVEQPFGRGRVAAFNLDLSISDADVSRTSDLARRGLFVWLVHTLAEHMRTASTEAAAPFPAVAPAAVETRRTTLPPIAVLLIMVWAAWAMEQVILARRRGQSPALEDAT